ncbi:MAG: hypothetical protein ABSB80_04220 [Methanoregula sp.]
MQTPTSTRNSFRTYILFVFDGNLIEQTSSPGAPRSWHSREK